MSDAKVAIVTGASSGIGAATAIRLHQEGFHLILGARRMDKLKQIAEPIGADAFELDVTRPQSVEEFCRNIERVDILVNNAGGAVGVESVAEADEDHWKIMYDTNVLGSLRMIRRLLPIMEKNKGGTIINITSIAAIEVYPGGAGYTAAKHAQKALSDTLRLELLGKPIRVTEIAPGMVETDFSLVRYSGDQDKAKKVYAGMTPLSAEDIADAIAWIATRPAHVNVDHLVMRPLDQATATIVHRTP